MGQVSGNYEAARRTGSSSSQGDATALLTIPQAIASERALIGILATFDRDGQLWVTVASKLSAASFRGPDTRRIIAEIYTLESEGKSIDFTSWGIAAEKAGLTDQEITSLLDRCDTRQGFDRYIEEIQEAEKRSRLIRLGTDIIRRASCDRDISAVLDTAMADTVAAAKEVDLIERDTTIFDLYEGLLAELIAVENGEATRSGITTGFTVLDDTTKLRPGCVYTFAGRTSTGKSALVLNMLANIAKEHPVFLYQLEMTAEQTAERMASREIGQPWRDFEQDRTLLKDFREELVRSSITNPELRQAAMQFYISAARGASVDAFSRKVRLRHAVNGIKVAALDYVQLIRPTDAEKREDKRTVISNAMGKIVDLAGELQIPIIVLSQLSREAEKRKGRPILSDLSESGSLENDSDFVGLIDRPVGSEVMELIIGKNRNGRAGHVLEAEFRPRSMIYEFIREL